MPILWIAVYCLIAVAVLFALTFHNEMLDEKSRCDKDRQAAANRRRPEACSR